MKIGGISCVVIDDDLASLKIMEVLIKRLPFLDFQASFDNPISATHYLMGKEIDLIFVDVEMPGVTGLELINTFSENQCVIVISGKREYAFEAFSLNVIDYLEKPIVDYSRFLSAVLKVQTVLSKRPPRPVKQNLFIKVDSVLHNVRLDQIFFVEAFGDYVKIAVNEKVMVTLATMKSMEAQLPVDEFSRVHKSFIVNIRKIEQIEQNNLKIAGKTIPISTLYREPLMNKLQHL